MTKKITHQRFAKIFESRIIFLHGSINSIDNLYFTLIQCFVEFVYTLCMKKIIFIMEVQKQNICHNFFGTCNAVMINYLIPAYCDNQFSVRINWSCYILCEHKLIEIFCDHKYNNSQLSGCTLIQKGVS